MSQYISGLTRAISHSSVAYDANNQIILPSVDVKSDLKSDDTVEYQTNPDKLIRENYEKIMCETDTKYIIESFHTIGMQLIKIENESLSATSSIISTELKEKEEEDTVIYYGINKTLFTNKNCVMIGRNNKFCDIVFNNKSISRIHVIIFFTKYNVYIVDPGSAYGITVNDKLRSLPIELVEEFEKGETNKRKMVSQSIYVNESKSSVKCNRVMKFPRNAPIKISINGFNVVVNPKTCIACMTDPRIIKVKCGHVIYCQGCFRSRYNNLCPLCRVDFSDQPEQNTLPCLTLDIRR